MDYSQIVYVREKDIDVAPCVTKKRQLPRMNDVFEENKFHLLQEYAFLGKQTKLINNKTLLISLSLTDCQGTFSTLNVTH